MAFGNLDEFRSGQAAGTAGGRESPRIGMALAEKRYTLKEQLGRGGMGEVWLAYDRMAGGDVALKFLPPALADVPQEMQRFHQTFARIRKVTGRYLCPLYDIQFDNRVGPFIVMKYVHGETLARRIERTGPLPPRDALEILSWAAAGLDELHAQAVVHRDVKPENIMLVEMTDDERTPLQIVDYSVAGEIRQSVSKLSGSVGFEGGTFAYMAPEQWRGKPAQAHSDQYALACVAYFLLTGAPPFQGDPGVLRLCHVNDIPDPIAGLPDAVNAALLQALQKDPKQRFSTCRQFIAAMQASDDSPAASPVSGGRPSPPPPPPPLDRKPGVVIPRKRTKPPPPPTGDTRTPFAAETVPNRVVLPHRAGPSASPSGSHPVVSKEPSTTGREGVRPTPAPGAGSTSSHPTEATASPLPLDAAARVGKSTSLGSWLLVESLGLGGTFFLWLVSIVAISGASGSGDGLTLLAGFAILFMPVGMIAWTIGFAAWLGTSWSAMPEADPKTSTLQAVVFLFIPIFGAFWLFRSQYLLISRLNAALSACGRNEAETPMLLLWLQLIPFVNLVALLVLQMKMNNGFAVLRRHYFGGE